MRKRVKTYYVGVVRVAYGTESVCVQATDKKKAAAKAIKEAYNLVFSDCNSEYEIDYVTEVK